jgi:hypothetical protein
MLPSLSYACFLLLFFDVFQDIYGVDLRHLPSVNEFITHVLQRYTRLDILFLEEEGERERRGGERRGERERREGRGREERRERRGESERRVPLLFYHFSLLSLHSSTTSLLSIHSSITILFYPFSILSLLSSISSLFYLFSLLSLLSSISSLFYLFSLLSSLFSSFAHSL